MILTSLLFVLAAQDTLPPEGRQMQSDIRYLAADAREGRGVGTTGLQEAGQYVAEAFRRIGLAPAGDSGSYFQSFVISPTAPGVMHTDLGGKAVRNVVAILPGRSPQLRGQIIVIGAHYDHLGLGGPNALDNPDSTGKVHNGADDNASGTTTLMDVARLLANRRLDRTVVFVAFTAEELGSLGSDYYVKHPTAGPVDSIYAMLNLDMVGRLKNGKLLALGAATAQQFPALLDSLNATGPCPASAAGGACARFDLRASGDGWSPSDNASFFAAKRPVLHFFTDLHEDYHRSTDDWEKINVSGMVQVAHFVADLATALATRPGTLTFVDAPRPQTTTSGGYGAYLGTIPDMSESPGGVRLSGVRAGSPAEQGGLKGGDIITRIGDKTVANLYDMTDALRAHHPGDTVTIVVKRDGADIPLSVVLGKRSE